MSRAPDLEEDVNQDQRHAAPNRQDYFLTIVSDNGHIVLDIRVAIEELVSPAPDEGSGKQKGDDGDSKYDAQSRNAGLFNHRKDRRYWVND
jgi:hypothetical protein